MCTAAISIPVVSISLLKTAVHHDHVEVVKILVIEEGFEKQKDRIMFRACLDGGVKVMEWLCSKGVELVLTQPLKGWDSLLHIAATQNQCKMIKFLIEKGVPVNDRHGPKGLTALLYAVYRDHSCAAQALVEMGADVEMATTSGVTPLLVASKCESSFMLIEKGANVRAKKNNGMGALHKAANTGGPGIASFI